MPKFKDCLGREWEIKLTLADLPRLREAGLNLSMAIKDGSTLDVLDDLEKRGQILWLLCEKQAESKKIDEREFALGFDGPAQSDAIDAFLKAFVNFSQRPTVAEAVNKKLSALVMDTERKAIQKIETGSGLSASGGSTPGLLDSTPAG